MTYRPGQGTAALLGTVFAVAVTTAVLASFFLFPGGGCNGESCGDASEPTVVAVGEVSASPTAPSTTPSGGPSGPGGQPTGGAPQLPTAVPSAPSDGDLHFSAQVDMPPAPEAQTANPDGVSAVIHAGPLRVLTPSSAGSGFLKVDRTTSTAKGRLDPMLVQDFRGSHSGWTLTATMSDFSVPGGRTLDADKLAWEPKCGAHPGGEPYPSTAVPGSPVSAGRTALLCSAPALAGVTGGQFDVGADIRLPVPAGSTTSGSYTATLLLTLA
ncbi:WxL domain-containing protein [Yinghuangia sp. YIM S09857]|uniref:WxL domain-containing protein n=1 Tax=Yinghuangia sp. YIM S09857 TaxID=3436929 RepID=UPI003F53DDD9